MVKTIYYKQPIESNIGNSKNLWNLIKDLAPEKLKVTPTSLKEGDACNTFQSTRYM